MNNILRTYFVIITTVFFLLSPARADYYYLSVPTHQNTDSETVAAVKKFKENDASVLDKVVMFTLDNRGGLMLSSLPLAAEINSLSEVLFSVQKKPLFVYVEKFCHSTCILTFFELLNLSRQNPNKLVVKVHTNAVFGFHGPSINGVVNLEGAKTYFMSLLRSGVNSDWVIKNSDIFTTTNLTYKTPGQLISENFGLLRQADIFGSGSEKQ